LYTSGVVRAGHFDWHDPRGRDRPNGGRSGRRNGHAYKYRYQHLADGQPQEAIAQLAPLAASPAADGRVRQNLALAYAMNGDLESCLQISRKDLDEKSAQRQLSYFMQLKALPIEARSAELRRNPNFFPQSSVGA